MTRKVVEKIKVLLLVDGCECHKLMNREINIERRREVAIGSRPSEPARCVAHSHLKKELVWHP